MYKNSVLEVVFDALALSDAYHAYSCGKFGVGPLGSESSSKCWVRLLFVRLVVEVALRRQGSF